MKFPFEFEINLSECSTGRLAGCSEGISPSRSLEATALIWCRRCLRSRSRRLFHCGSSPRFGRSPRTPHYADVNNLNWSKWLVGRGVGGHPRNLFYQSHRGLIALPKNCIATIQVRRCYFGDKKLRAVGARPGIRISKPPRLIKEQIGRAFILKLVSRISRSVPSGIAALNHEIGNDPVKDCAVIKRYSMFCGSAHRILPVLCPVRQADKVLDSNRCLVRK